MHVEPPGHFGDNRRVIVIETERLTLRHLGASDAGFIVELLNEPSFIRNIADRGVRTIADAEAYLLAGPLASYGKFGHGLFAVTLKGQPEPLGVCGLMRRDGLEHPDLAYAFLPRYWRNGYALESATAVLQLAKNRFALRAVLAITNPDNVPSIGVLTKLGFEPRGMTRLPGETAEVRLFEVDPSSVGARMGAA